MISQARPFLVLAMVLCSSTLVGGSCRRAADPVEPNRLYSIGDSMTRGFDSWFIGDNLPVSWVNGYHGITQALLGIPDINSIFQRLEDMLGDGNVANVVAAQNGARWEDGLGQAQGVVQEQSTFVSVLLGGNDVCRDSIGDLPTDEEFRGHVQDTLGFLAAQLPAGATVQVGEIPDIKRLHDVAIDEKGLLGLDCPAIWLTTVLGFPCGSMLSPFNTEADRLFVQQRNFAYNDIIGEEVAALQGQSVAFILTAAESIPFVGDDISSIDCFHPSAQGEALIAEVAWTTGPFGP